MNCKNVFSIIMMVVCSVWLGANNGWAQNGLTNGNFEAGTTGWFTFGTSGSIAVDTTGAKEGAQCGKVIMAGGTSGFVQQKIWGALNIKGKTLQLSGWAKTAFGTGGTPSISLTKAVKVANVWEDLSTLEIRTGETAAWTHMQGIFTLLAGPTVDPGTTNITDFLSPRLAIDTTGVTGDSTVWLDDFMLQEVTGDPNNLLTNGNFELGTAGWVAWPEGTVVGEIDTQGAQEGSQAMKLTIQPNIQNTGILTQSYTGPLYAKGQKLALSAWVKASFGTGGTPSVILHRAEYKADGSAAAWEALESRTGNVASWTKLQGAFTLVGGADPGQPLPQGALFMARLVADTTGVSGASTVWWDDVLLKAVAETGDLLINGSFEFGLGSWQQWNAAGSGLTLSSIDATDALDGSKVCKMEWTNGPGARQLLQDIIDPTQAKLIPGRWLMLTAWYKAQLGNQKEYAALSKWFGDEQTNPDLNTNGNNSILVTGDRTSWTQQFYAFRVPPTGNYKSLRVSFSIGTAGVATGGNALLDDMKLLPYTPGQGTNLMLNGSFEGDLQTWQKWCIPNSVITVNCPSDGSAKEGSKYAKLDFPATTKQVQLIYDVNTDDLTSMGVPDGTELTFSAWYRANIPADNRVWLNKVYNTTTGDESGYADNGGVAGPQSTWTKMSLTFTYVNDPSTPLLRLIMRAGKKMPDESIIYSGTAGWLNWDDVRLDKPVAPTRAGNWELY